jgi:hypothetical protein
MKKTEKESTFSYHKNCDCSVLKNSFLCLVELNLKTSKDKLDMLCFGMTPPLKNAKKCFWNYIAYSISEFSEFYRKNNDNIKYTCILVIGKNAYLFDKCIIFKNLKFDNLKIISDDILRDELFISWDEINLESVFKDLQNKVPKINIYPKNKKK